MKKIVFLLGIVALLATGEAKAFSVFDKSPKDGKAKEAAAAAAPAPTSASAAPPAPTEEKNPLVPTPPVTGIEQQKQKEDPILKSVQDLQKKYYEEAEKQRLEYQKNREELLLKYRKKIESENPKKLQEYTKQCETQAIERYAMESGAYMGMPMMPPMMP